MERTLPWGSWKNSSGHITSPQVKWKHPLGRIQVSKGSQPHSRHHSIQPFWNGGDQDPSASAHSSEFPVQQFQACSQAPQVSLLAAEDSFGICAGSQGLFTGRLSLKQIIWKFQFSSSAHFRVTDYPVPCTENAFKFGIPCNKVSDRTPKETFMLQLMEVCLKLHRKFPGDTFFLICHTPKFKWVYILRYFYMPKSHKDFPFQCCLRSKKQ